MAMNSVEGGTMVEHYDQRCTPDLFTGKGASRARSRRRPSMTRGP
jgi:hypothetical protein